MEARARLVQVQRSKEQVVEQHRFVQESEIALFRAD
jgi:hypothetical protein